MSEDSKGEAMNKIDKMWTALADHQPAPEYAEAWQKMIKERTYEAAYKAADAAWAAADAAEEARAAQRAINEIKEVQS